jgi:superfamily II DNA or RNA helicase
LTLEPLVPTPEQWGVIWKAAYEPTCANLDTSNTGAGKTLTTIEIAKIRDVKTMLVIGPKGTRTGWQVTAERQGLDLPFRWIVSTKNTLAKDGDEYKALKAGEPGIYFVGIELFVSMGWDRVLAGGIDKKTGKPKMKNVRNKVWESVYPDMAVVDEAHRASNRKTKTFRTLQMDTGRNHLRAKYKRGMSATYEGNSFDGAYAMPKWLWPDIIDTSFTLWKGRWAKTEYDPFSYSKNKIVGEKNPGAWLESLPCWTHIEVKRGPREDHTVKVELSAKQRQIYDALETDYLAWLGENPLVIELPIQMRTRQRQVTLGEPTMVPTGEDEFEVDFAKNCKSTKMEALVGIIQSDIDEESALIFSDSRKFNQNVVIPRLRDLGYRVEAWDSTQSDKKREETKEAFMRGEVDYIVAVIKAAGEGIDGFQAGTRNAIWLTKDDDGVKNIQADGRVHRQGQTQTMRNFVIEAIDTRDQDQYSSLVSQEIARRKRHGKEN